MKVRTELFHAKGSRPSLLPQAGGKSQHNVVAILERLGRLFLKLAESELHANSNLGFLFAAGFDYMTRHLKTKLTIHVTDNADVEHPENMFDPARCTVIDLETRHAPELEKPYLRSLLGHVNGSQLEKLTRVSAIVSKLDDGTPVTCGTIDGVLQVNDLVRFESQISIRNQNTQQPRGYFAS